VSARQNGIGAGRTGSHVPRAAIEMLDFPDNMKLAIRILLVLVLWREAGAHAQAPTVSVAPFEPLPGSIVRISVTPASAPEDSITSVRGTMAGEPLRFLAADSGRFHAIGGVPVDATDSVAAIVIVQRASRAVDSVRAWIAIPAVDVPTTEPTLAVAQRFTRPLDARTQARVARENELARAVGRRAHDSPPMWTAQFLRPRDSRVTSEFGTGRMFNGVVASRHLGVDYAGASGTEVRAANRGVVALVDTFFLAGRLVYIDHGGGVVTGYFHLSKPLVAKGDTVARGKLIGLVGATGRVTGPHLHWTARYGALPVNPTDLLELELSWYSGKLAGRP
jgi:murein DD-endopeptidase MepM/ murein hydrolase activator NlpD